MKPLVFASNRSFSGKSSMCVGIGKILKEKGYKVGYLKPICMIPEKVGSCYVDEDVRYIIDILDIKDDAKNVCPLIFTEQSYDKALKEKINSSSVNYIDGISRALENIKKDKDIVFVESARNLTYASFAGISAKDICLAFDARVILIMKYENDVIDKIILFKDYFGANFGGIIINMVPAEDKERIESLIIPFLKKTGITLFGVLYSDKILSSISINDMSRYLDGEILCAESKAGDLVDSFMVGAMGHEMALRFFRSKPDKVVITGGDRADIQLAALETNTKCLVLTGNFYPSTIVLSRADELGVPMILVKHDTLTTVSKLNEVLGRSNLHEIKKLDKLIELIRKSIDVDGIISIAK
jgi:BioD-like phosphotransacetylase family protein